FLSDVLVTFIVSIMSFVIILSFLYHFFTKLRRQPKFIIFPYTTLFRSSTDQGICRQYVSARFLEEWITASSQYSGSPQYLCLYCIPGIHTPVQRHLQIWHRSGQCQKEPLLLRSPSAPWLLFLLHRLQTAGSWCWSDLLWSFLHRYLYLSDGTGKEVHR